MSRISIHHHIATITTDNNNDCWAASIAMVMRRHSIDGTNHVKVLADAAHVPLDQGTMPDSSVQQLAGAVRLGFHDFQAREITLPGLEALLRRGPVAAFGFFNYPGNLSARKHVVAIYALIGDGTARGTRVQLIDPSARVNPFMTDWQAFIEAIADITFVLSY